MESKPALHPADETLVSYGLGKLDDTVAAQVHKHLEQCQPCRQRVAELSSDSFLNRLRAADARPEAMVATPASQAAAPGAAGKTAETISLNGAERETSADDARSNASRAVAPLSPAAVPPELANHPQYEILRELGRGGMGVVYLARNKLMDRLDVLKIVNRETVARQGPVDRFLREIQSAARLQHQNVVAAHFAFQAGDLLVFAMEYVEGRDLAKLVRERGPLPVFNACYFAYQAAQGLQHAHERGMVHRDIKPGNLILWRQGRKAVVKILDFGLAKVASAQRVDTTLTQEGQILGTPDFIAPEQTLDAQNADIRADIYSLGCTLYFLLAGSPPFRGGNVYQLLMAHQSTEAKALNLVRPDVPVELAAVVAKMMAKDPKDRYQTPAEAAQALKPFLTGDARPAGGDQGMRTTIAESAEQPAGKRGGQIGDNWESVIEGIEFDQTPVTRQARPGQSTSRERPPWIWIAAAAGVVIFGFVLMWAGGVLKIKTKDGVIVIEGLPADADVLVDGEQVTVEWPGGGAPAQISVAPGKRGVEVKKDGFRLYGETVEIASGERKPLRVNLEFIRVTPAVAPNEKVSAPRPPVKPPDATDVGKEYLVLHPFKPEVVGFPPGERIGFPQDTLQTVFDDDRPRIVVPETAPAGKTFSITRLFLCREDAVPTANNPNVLELRQVNLWVPVKGTPYAQAVPRPDGNARTLQPTRRLPDGVYCVHTGTLTDSKALPDFCCPIVVRGYGVPQIEKASAEVGATDVKLTVVVRNSGLGEFNDGFFVATLQMQTREGTLPEFKGRQHFKIAPIGAKGQRQLECRWKIADLKPGEYFFAGHVNYEHLWDPNKLATFRTDSFAISPPVPAEADR